MYNERFAIQQRMSEIKEERRELKDEYYKLMDRLRDLDKDSGGADITGLATELTKAVQLVASIVPPVTAHQVIERVVRDSNAHETVITTDKTPSETNRRVGAAVQQAQINGVPSVETSLKRLTPTDAVPKVVTILRENGEMKAKDIEKELADRGYFCNTNVHELLRRAKVDNLAQNISFGVWTAIESEKDQQENHA